MTQNPNVSPAPIRSSSLFFSPLPPTYVPLPAKESHGRYMLTIPWNRVAGWGQPHIGPRQDMSFDPLSGVLQYAVTCFEGMKCFKSEKGDLKLFRPRNNFDRFKRSAGRLGLPCEWDNEELLILLSKLLSLEADLIPTEDGSSLYIRPTLVETSESYGIKEDAYAAEALMYIVTTKNLGKGLYSSAEGKGIRLDACKEYIRAWPGGTGSYKLGANYGTVNIAKKQGYAMSLWLHGKEDFISEAGAMNVWIIREAEDGFVEFVTMSLENGIVLPGITRLSIMQLLTDHAEGQRNFPLEGMPRKIRVVERDLSMPEVVSGIEDGSLKGMFGSGTGVVVVSIGEIQYESQTYKLPYNPLILLLRDTITGIQRGRIPHEWTYTVPAWDAGPKGEDRVDGQTAFAG